MVENWVRITLEHSCPVLTEVMLLLPNLSSIDDIRKIYSPVLHFHHGSVEINLSGFFTVQGDNEATARACLVQLIHAASAHPLVLSVSLGEKFHFSNYDAVAMSQSGTGLRQTYRRAGLNGKNQICGVADTGLDGKLNSFDSLFCFHVRSYHISDTSCFFRDNFNLIDESESKFTDASSYSEAEMRDEASYISPTTKRSYIVESKRRKVIQYVPYADSTDSRG